MMRVKWKDMLHGREEGALAVEGLFVFLVLIFFLVFLLNFSILLYQQWVVTFTANDTASRLGQSYAYPGADPIMGYVSAPMKAALSPYRYFGNKLADGCETKGELYAAWSLRESSLMPSAGQPKIEVKTVYDGFSQRHVVVDIEVKYKFPMGGILKFVGLGDTVTYHATGRAVCLDVSGYIHSVNSAASLCGNSFSSKIYSLVDKVLGFINTIRDALED